MALTLLEAWHARGYAMDVVMYRKYAGSTYVEPHEHEKVAFKDLPDRFPSVLSRDFRNEGGQYEDFDNLYALYLLYNLGKYRVLVNGQTRLLEIEQVKTPIAYPQAAKRATEDAKADSDNYRRRLAFRPKGTRIGQSAIGTGVR